MACQLELAPTSQDLLLFTTDTVPNLLLLYMCPQVMDGMLARLAATSQDLLHYFRSIEMPTAQILADVESRGIAVNVARLRRYGARTCSRKLGTMSVVKRHLHRRA
jgi:hypothetical protein